MKRTTAASVCDAPDFKVSVPKDYKVPVSKAPGETKVIWNSDSSLVAVPREEEARRKAPEMKFLYVLSAALTLMVLWGIFREAKFKLPTVLYGSTAIVGKDAMQINKVDSNAVKPSSVEDPIDSPAGRKEARQFLEKYPYSFGTKISDWDKQRRTYLASETTSGVRKQPRVFIVSGSQPERCVDPLGDHYLLKFLKNRLDYSRLHGIRNHFYSLTDIDEGVNRFWVKVPLLRTLMLEHPDVEWLWWLDSEALFTDMTFDIPFEKYKNYNFIIQGSSQLVYREKRWSGLNTGVFLIRNCQWSLDFLQAWARMADKEFESKWGAFLSENLSGRAKNLPAEDQSAAVYLLSWDRSIWGEKVFMENSLYLAEYWKNALKRLEGVDDQHQEQKVQLPFITHFAGCQPCSGVFVNATIAECKEGMEHAFNFADNQVLKILGFRHSDLSSYSVKPLESS